MSEILDDVLRKWAISQVCPNGEPTTEYELRAVKNHMYFGLKLLQEAQPVIAELEAEIARLKAEREWQKIETAPKSAGTEILVTGFGGITVIDSYFSDNENITHWMPLPQPPEDAE